METLPGLEDVEPEIRGDAQFSKCGRYRYWLFREWNFHGDWCAFIMLNPSTATATEDDPTIRRCIGFARAWGFGAVEIVNLFAWRATDPADLKKATDPVGELTDRAILAGADIRKLVVAAWGVHGAHMGRDEQVREMLGEEGIVLHHLGLTKDGHPKHPLYLRGDTKPQEWEQG